MKKSSNFSRPDRWWDWPAVLLLIAAMLTVAIRLNTTHWTRELVLVQTVTFFGLVAGLALGQSIFSPRTVRYFSFAYGSFVIVWQVGLTLGEGIPWLERLALMGDQLWITLEQIFLQKPVTDNLFFHLLMSTLFWTISVYSGYSLTRHGSPWRAIIPAGMALVIIHTFDAFFQIRTWFLAGFLFLALLLIARMNFVRLRFAWKNNGTYLPPSIGLDSIRLGLITTAVVLLLAWTVPALASSFAPAERVWRTATQPWTDVRNRLSNVFYSLQASVGVVTDFYGDVLPLGRGTPLTDTVIMTIEAPTRSVPGLRYYWRSRVYDYYEDNWVSTLDEVKSVEPSSSELIFPEYENRETSVFTILTNFPIQNLSMPSQPLLVNRPAEVSLATNPDGTADLAYFKATPLMQSGDQYQVISSIQTASISDLRAAGADYPEWVTDRYLQLPETITPRTLELARQITEGLDNPYDITQVITEWLRINLSYSDTVPAAPEGREPIDWILFEHREAFCNYYATSEVIMLRSLGIPARLAVGYAQGERHTIESAEIQSTLGAVGEVNPQDITPIGEIYTIRHRDAHAWPEVYFPGIGWVEFEPTVSQQPIIRPIGGLDSPDPQAAQAADDLQDRLDSLNREADREGGEIAPDSLTLPWFASPFVIWTSLILVVTASAYFLIKKVRVKRGSPPVPVQLESTIARVGLKPPVILKRWARFASLTPLARAYLEINHALSRLGQPPAPNETPSERADRLIALFPPVELPVRDVLSAYLAATYGNHPENGARAYLAGKEIRKLSYQALFKRTLARIQGPNRASPPLMSARP